MNDIVKYYEDELKKLRAQLTGLEDNLTEYNIANSVINYTDQTKAIASSYADFENRYETNMRDLESSAKILKELDTWTPAQS